MWTVSTRAYRRDRHKTQFTPMVDCVFLLLIFFLSATKIEKEEGDFVTRGMGAPGPEITVHEVVRVWVSEGPAGVLIRVGGLETGSFAELAQTLQRLPHDDLMVVIAGPPDLTMQTVARTLDAVKEAGVESVTFETGQGRG